MNLSKIKELRLKKRLSLDELAKKSLVSKAYLSCLENHDGNPSIDILTSIATALDVSVYYLCSDEREMSQEEKDIMFLNKFHSLSDSDQAKIEDIINLWLEVSE